MSVLFTLATNLTPSMDAVTNITNTGAHQHHQSWLRILRIAVMCVLVLVILSGNLLILAGVRKIEEMRSVTGIFLANLAISDLGVGLICLPIAIAASVDENLLSIKFVCSVDGFSLVLFFIGSIQTLCAISVHKHTAVVYAMKITITRKRAYMMVACVWIISLLLAIGPLFGWSKYIHIPGRHQCSTPPPTDRMILSHMIMLLGFGYAIPVFTMIFCYSRLYCTTRAHLRRLKATAISDAISTTESDLINTLVLVLLCFILCWLPFVVYICYGMTKKPIPYYLPTIAFLFGYGNSALNPVIYALRHKSFRKGFKAIIWRITGFNNHSPNNTLMSMVNKNSPRMGLGQKTLTEANNALLVAEPLIRQDRLHLKTNGSDCSLK